MDCPTRLQDHWNGHTPYQQAPAITSIGIAMIANEYEASVDGKGTTQRRQGTLCGQAHRRRPDASPLQMQSVAPLAHDRAPRRAFRWVPNHLEFH